MAFLETIVGVIADRVADKVIERFDSYVSKSSQFNAKEKARSKKGAAFKKEIAAAQSLEERDAILDKFDDLFDDNLSV